MRRKPEITVAAIAEHHGKFLMIEEHVNGQLVINQPAGHLENRETLIQAVSRECYEESGWQFEPQALCGIYSWHHPKRDCTVIRFAFIGKAHSHDTDAVLDEGIERALWLTRDEIRQHRNKLRTYLVEHAVNDYFAGRRYPLDVLSDMESPYQSDIHHQAAYSK